MSGLAGVGSAAPVVLANDSPKKIARVAGCFVCCCPSSGSEPRKPLHCQPSSPSQALGVWTQRRRDMASCHPVDLEPFACSCYASCRFSQNGSWRCFRLTSFSPLQTNDSALTACIAPDPETKRFESPSRGARTRRSKRCSCATTQLTPLLASRRHRHRRRYLLHSNYKIPC